MAKATAKVPSKGKEDLSGWEKRVVNAAPLIQSLPRDAPTAPSAAGPPALGSFSDQAGRVSSIWVSACVGLPGVGAGPGRGIWEGQVASVRPWAAFGRPRGLERGHSGGSMYKVGFGRGRLLPTSVVLIDLY